MHVHKTDFHPNLWSRMDVDSPLINHLHTNMLFVPQVIRLAHENSSKEETQFHGM